MARRRPDPGLVFQYEDERFVLGHLRAPHDTSEGKHPPGMPMSNDELNRRIFNGTSMLVTEGYTPETVGQILASLEAAGDAASTDEGWEMTAQGFAKLTGPNGYDPGPMPQHQVDALLAAGEIDQEGYDAWKEAHDAYHAEEGSPTT